MFGNPGSTELPLMDALMGQKEIRYLLALHEGIAVSMADAYSVMSGNLSALNFHTTPGVGNAMGMLYNAYKANAPLLVTAGQHDQTFLFSEPILFSNLTEVPRPFVKWSYEVRRLEDLPKAVHRAAKVALSHPMGPVFLSLPLDILKSRASLDLGFSTRIDPRPRPSRSSMTEAAEMLSRAGHPVIIAGDAVARGGAHAELARVAELIGAPVYEQTVSGTCNFPSSHPLSMGPLPRVQKITRKALQDADLLFSVCADLLTMSLPSDQDPLPPGLKVIHLHLDPWEIGKNYPARVAMIGDPKEALPELEEALAERLTPEEKQKARDRMEKARRKRAEFISSIREKAGGEMDRTPMTPLSLIEAVCSTLPSDAVLVDETISSGGALRALYRGDDPRSYLGMRGGGIGWGVPAALGAKLAVGNRPVVALIGDGSSMYSCQGLWTAAHEGLAVTYLICNNSGYRILKQRTRALEGVSAKTGSYLAMDLERPEIDFVGLAKSLGVPGERCEKIPELKSALRRALKQTGPVLIDARLQKEI